MTENAEEFEFGPVRAKSPAGLALVAVHRTSGKDHQSVRAGMAAKDLAK